MSFNLTPLIFEKFKGIREQNGINANGAISAISCNNVQLVQTEIGGNTGIRTVEGNYIGPTLPIGYRTIGTMKSTQNGIDYFLLYGENATKGTLFYINITGKVEAIVDNLTLTGECNGLTMTTTAYDVFVFTNGVEVRTVCFTKDDAYKIVIADHNPVEFSQGYVATIEAEDYEGNKLHWISMDVFNSSLAVASEYGPRGSHQNDIYTWNDNPVNAVDSWYINMTKKVTAVKTFTGGLYIFTEDDCTRLTGNPNDIANTTLTTSAGVGCYSWSSIVKHDLYLFFYDNNQRNIYYLTPTDTTGQIKPSGPAAREIQSYFKNITSFKMYSCVYNNRNEIWCIINDNILIYDYIQQEWVTRQQQEINDLVIFDNIIYTAGESGVVYVEGGSDDFSGAYFPSLYETTYINAGSNSNIKKQKTPLLITVNSNFTNDFYVQLTVDNKTKSPKRKKVSKIRTGIFAAEDGSSTDPRTKYGTAKYAPENTYRKTVIEVSTPQTWYTMNVKIYTTTLGQGFFITSMELKNMKAKGKTKGR